MSNQANLTFENQNNPEAGLRKWPETMWPLDQDVLHGLPDQLWPDRDELESLRYPWELLAVLNRIREERITETRGETEVNFDDPNKVNIKGPVWFAPGVKVRAFSIIEGPAYVGGNVGSFSLTRESLLGRSSLVGAYCEVARSVFGTEAVTSHKNIVLDSILSTGAHLGGGTHTANVRSDGGEISATVGIGGPKIATGLRSFGTIIGARTEFGSNGATMPGKLVGEGSVIGPSVDVYSNVPDSTRVENARAQLAITSLEQQLRVDAA
jgi:NDP-sugar pyrophosphorylase family protein